MCALCAMASAANLRAAEPDPFQGLSGELRIAGSEAGLPAVLQAARLIMEANPAVTVTVWPTGTGIAVKQVKNRQAAIALADREFDLAALASQGLEVVHYAIDPVAVVVNPVNTVMGLTLAQAKSVFGGRIKLWGELGGRQDAVLPLYLQASEAEDKPLTQPGTMSVATQPAAKWAVSHNKDIVGCLSLRDLDASVKPLLLDGSAPTYENVSAGSWKVFRKLYLVLDKEPKGLAKAFVEYMLGPGGQALLAEAGYVPLAAKPARESVLAVGNPEELLSGN